MDNKAWRCSPLNGSKQDFTAVRMCVTCGALAGQLVRSKFLCPGIHQHCIEFDGRLITPKMFSVMGEKERLKDWKNAIRIGGVSFRKLMDSGELQFYDHDNNCTGRCISRNSGTSKYDIKIEYLTRLSSESDLPSFIPFAPTLSEHAYTILREMQGDSPCSSESSDHSSHQPSSTTRPAEGVAIKSEPVSDSDDSGVPGSDREAMVNVAPPHDSKSTHAVDVLDLDAVVEDSEALWQGIVQVGLLDEFFREIKHSLDQLKNGLIRNGVEKEESEKMSRIVSELGLMTKLKWKLSEHKRAMWKQDAKLQVEIEELKRKVAESEAKRKELKRKSQCFDKLLDVSRPKAVCMNTPNSTTE